MMSRGSRLALLGLALSSFACRASDADCVALAQHIVDLAEAEARAGGRTADTLEASCKEQQPTRALVECMMAAQSLAGLDDC